MEEAASKKCARCRNVKLLSEFWRKESNSWTLCNSCSADGIEEYNDCRRDELAFLRSDPICSVLGCKEKKVCRSRAYGKCTEHGGIEQLWLETLHGWKYAPCELRDPDGKLAALDDVKKAYATQDGLCFYCGYRVKIRRGKARNGNNISIERLDNAKGHRADNIVIACFFCNAHRNATELEVFIPFTHALFGDSVAPPESHPRPRSDSEWSTRMVTTELRKEHGWTAKRVRFICEEQSGRCAITDIPFCPCTVPLCSWKPSIDRISNDLGHEEDNCHLVLLGTNFGRAKATIEQYRKMLAARRISFPDRPCRDWTPPPAAPRPPKALPRIHDFENGVRTCSACKAIKSIRDFAWHNVAKGKLRSSCRSCTKEDNKRFRKPKTARIDRQADERVLRDGEPTRPCKRCGDPDVPEHGMCRHIDWCLACRRLWETETAEPKQRHEALLAEEQPKQQCSRCDDIKPAKDFASSRFGTMCRECKSKSTQRSREDSREREKKQRQEEKAKKDAEAADRLSKDEQVWCEKGQHMVPVGILTRTDQPWCTSCAKSYDRSQKTQRVFADHMRETKREQYCRSCTSWQDLSQFKYHRSNARCLTCRGEATKEGRKCVQEGCTEMLPASRKNPRCPSHLRLYKANAKTRDIKE